jgi:hypothetical protein
MVEQVPPGGFKAAADSHHDRKFAPKKLRKGKVPPKLDRRRRDLKLVPKRRPIRSSGAP